MHWRTVGRMAAMAAVFGAMLLGCAGGSQTSATTAKPAGSGQGTDVPLQARTVWAGSYQRDIQPIFDQYCVSCHGSARAENGLRLDSYQGAMKGTQNGAVIVAGSPSTSALMSVIQGTAAAQIRMPHEARTLTHNRIENIRLWIGAGAPND